MRTVVQRQVRTLFVFLVLAAFGSAPATVHAADVSSTYLKIIRPSLVLVAAHQGGETSFGTGFCIYSKNGVSYFVTNHHVIANEATDAVYSTVEVLRPSDPKKRYRAAVVKPGSVIKDWPPDLALIRASMGNLPIVHLSSQRPLEGMEVGIAGFPAFQLKVWLEQSHGEELRPSFHDGHVNALTLGDFYVQYDALTDQGNSGGPVFDAHTGAIYGVVEESVKGQSVSNNLALSEVVLRRFIASVDLPIKLAPLDRRLAPPADERIAAGQSDTCTTALQHFSKHFNEFVSARALGAAASNGTDQSFKSDVIERFEQLRAALAQHLLARDLGAIQKSGAKQTAGLAEKVYDDAIAAPSNAPAKSTKLKAAVLEFDTSGDCATDG
jgi:hypothetical protein